MKAKKDFILVTVFFISIFAGSASAQPCLFGDFETQQLHFLVNKFRSSNGLLKLECDLRIVDAAWEHSRQMCLDGRLHHDGLPERVQSIVQAMGIKPTFSAENAAYNWSGSAQKAVEQWKNSDFHRQNMLRPDADYYGGGIYGCQDGKTYFTMIFIGQ
jgi:uncharacterized protein YkwD